MKRSQCAADETWPMIIVANPSARAIRIRLTCLSPSAPSLQADGPASPASCRGAAIAHRSIDEYVPVSSQPRLQSFRNQACLEAVFLLPTSSGALRVSVLSFHLRLQP